MKLDFVINLGILTEGSMLGYFTMHSNMDVTQLIGISNLSIDSKMWYIYMHLNTNYQF